LRFLLGGRPSTLLHEVEVVVEAGETTHLGDLVFAHPIQRYELEGSKLVATPDGGQERRSVGVAEWSGPGRRMLFTVEPITEVLVRFETSTQVFPLTSGVTRTTFVAE
jgi:hypothetical protein